MNNNSEDKSKSPDNSIEKYNFPIFYPEFIDNTILHNRKRAAFVGILTSFLFLIAALLIDLKNEGNFVWTRTFLFTWYYWVFTLGLMLAFISVVHWRLVIPSFFNWLKTSNYLTVKKGNQFDLDFMDNIQKYADELKSIKGRLLIFILLLGLGLVSFNIMAYYTGWEKIDSDYIIINGVLFCGLSILFFLGSTIIWAMIQTGGFIRDLTEEFEFSIFPSHPDKCGGLKPIGDFCYTMTLPIFWTVLLIVILMVGNSVINATQVPSTYTRIGQPFDTKQITPDVQFVLFIFLVIMGIPTMSFSFLTPLWQIHTYMTKARKNAEDAYAKKAFELEEIISKELTHSKGLEIVTNAKEKLDILKILPPGNPGYPTWPFRMTLVATLYSPTMIALAALIVSIVIR